MIEPREVCARLPVAPGVYRFRDARGRTLYLGRATELRRRVASYWGDLGDRRHLVRMVPQIVRVEAVACESVHEAAWLERNLLERSKPRWNRIRGGMEVPVYIRLERRADGARLRVVHDGRPAGPDLFGPYLGGTRTRLAVSALHRALPLAYAGDRLTGCERDLARARGVDREDRAALLTEVTSVLRRHRPAVDAVTARLVAHRDRASAALSFELAAQIQQEIEAIDWVTATQRVTLADAADCDVCGWAGGTLVRFELRDGRLCTWQQRPSTRTAAQRRLDDTPDTWREFARRAAELAVDLDAAHRGVA